VSGALSEQHLVSARLVHRMIPAGFAIAPQRSMTMRRCTPSRSKPIGNWLIGLGCLLAIVVAVAAGNGATIAVGKNPLRPDRVLTNAITLQGDADHYVEGLARLGIVRLPCFPGLVAQFDLTRVSICALTLAGSLPGTRMAGARCRLPRICLCSRRCQGRGSHSVRVSLRTG
jgi:hypothetical protein